MLSAMKAKLALLIHTKVGATVLAATLVAGGGSAVAMAATHGNLNQLGSTLASAAGGNHESTSDHEGDNSANHESMEGTLKGYTPPNGSTPGWITVQPLQGSAATFKVTSGTKVNGYHTQGQHSEATPSASQHTEGTPSASHESESTPSASQHTEGTPSASHESDSEQAGTLNDLAAAIGHKVQVQADKSGGSWVASKVTIQGADSESGDGSGSSGHESTPTARPTSSGEHESTPTAKPTATGGHG